MLKIVKRQEARGLNAENLQRGATVPQLKNVTSMYDN